MYWIIEDISRTFGVSVSGCTHKHVNCNLEFIKLLLMCMLIYQPNVEGIIILRRSSTDECLMWLLKFFHVKVDYKLPHSQHERVRLASQLHNKSTVFKWKNFSNHTRHSLVELRLRIIIPSTIVWYININMDRSRIHSKLQFTCWCVQSDTNTPNAWLIDPQP